MSVAEHTMPDFNNVMREGVLGLVSEELPGGGVLSFIIGLFWPETDTSAETWNSIKKYAEELVGDAIDKERVETLNKRMAGLQKLATDYKTTSMGSPQKGQYLTSVMSQLDVFEPDFWDDRNPEKMFPMFSSFGTLWLAALADQAYYYKDIYNVDDVDAKTHLDKFHSETAKYISAAQATFDRLYEWRFGLLEITETNEGAWGTDVVWTFTDKYDGFSDRNSKLYETESVAANRVAQINNDFVESLQSILAVAQLWSYFDPTAPRPESKQVVSTQGPFGGLGGDGFVGGPASDASHITRIGIRDGGQVVECLEMSYDGKSDGARGNPQGANPKALDLAADEYVTEVSGRSGIFVDLLQFKTNKGRTIAGGNATTGAAFSNSGHSSWEDAKLFAVDGRSDDLRVTQVTLRWAHRTSMAPYVPSYKRNGAPLTASSRVYLKTLDDQFVGALREEYSGTAAANEYFPIVGAAGSLVELELRLTDGQAGTLSDRQAVKVWTSESVAKDYPYLAKYSSDYVYYYSGSDDDRQLWVIVKMIPTAGPVLSNEKVYLRNVADHGHLYPAEGGYLATSHEPYAWRIVTK